VDAVPRQHAFLSLTRPVPRTKNSHLVKEAGEIDVDAVPIQHAFSPLTMTVSWKKGSQLVREAAEADVDAVPFQHAFFPLTRPVSSKKGSHFVKEAGEVDVNAVPCHGVHQDILPVSVPQSQHVANHAPHRGGAGERDARVVPAGGLREIGQKKTVQQRRKHVQYFVQQICHLLPLHIHEGIYDQWSS
jgi:hypothetical protein